MKNNNIKIDETAGKAEVKKLRAMTDRALLKYLSPKRPCPPVLFEAMRYSIFAGGKRLRPVLALLTARALGTDIRKALPAACAVEMIHTYSLIHDDLPAMDDDDMRRGKPTSHKKFGEANAILAGDALLTMAFEILSQPVKGVKPSDSMRAALAVAKGAGATGMVAGQAMDIINEGKKVSRSAVEYTHACKTGALITAAVLAGAHCAGASPAQVSAFKLFSARLGLAFQIIDDILDVTSDSKTLGKKAGKDKKAGKATYPAMYGLEKSRKMAQKLTLEAKSILYRIDKSSGNKKARQYNGLLYLADYFVKRTY